MDATASWDAGKNSVSSPYADAMNSLSAKISPMNSDSVELTVRRPYTVYITSPGFTFSLMSTRKSRRDVRGDGECGIRHENGLPRSDDVTFDQGPIGIDWGLLVLAHVATLQRASQRITGKQRDWRGECGGHNIVREFRPCWRCCSGCGGTHCGRRLAPVRPWISGNVCDQLPAIEKVGELRWQVECDL